MRCQRFLHAGDGAERAAQEQQGADTVRGRAGRHGQASVRPSPITAHLRLPAHPAPSTSHIVPVLPALPFPPAPSYRQTGESPPGPPSPSCCRSCPTARAGGAACRSARSCCPGSVGRRRRCGASLRSWARCCPGSRRQGGVVVAVVVCVCVRGGWVVGGGGPAPAGLLCCMRCNQTPEPGRVTRLGALAPCLAEQCPARRAQPTARALPACSAQLSPLPQHALTPCPPALACGRWRWTRRAWRRAWRPRRASLTRACCQRCGRATCMPQRSPGSSAHAR